MVSVANSSVATCVCPPQFTGATCATRNDCFSNPCTNGTLCVPFPAGGFQCVCVSLSCLPTTTTIAPSTIAPSTIAPSTIAPSTIAPSTIASTTIASTITAVLTTTIASIE